jgi:hypothetical protein
MAISGKISRNICRGTSAVLWRVTFARGNTDPALLVRHDNHCIFVDGDTRGHAGTKRRKRGGAP